MKCPLCSTDNAYIGFNSVECSNSACAHYKAPALPRIAELMGDFQKLPLLSADFSDAVAGAYELLLDQLRAVGFQNPERFVTPKDSTEFGKPWDVYTHPTPDKPRGAVLPVGSYNGTGSTLPQHVYGGYNGSITVNGVERKVVNGQVLGDDGKPLGLGCYVVSDAGVLRVRSGGETTDFHTTVVPESCCGKKPNLQWKSLTKPGQDGFFGEATLSCSVCRQHLTERLELSRRIFQVRDDVTATFRNAAFEQVIQKWNGGRRCH